MHIRKATIEDARAIAGYLASGYEYHVAEEHGRFVGVVGVRDNSHLYHLFVDDNVRGQGAVLRPFQ